MHIHGCKAIPADGDQTSRCPNHASAPSAFCREHAEEHRALEERERTAAREADRLKSIVDDIVTQDANAYTRSREISKDERVVGLYLESLEQQVDAAVALKTRFFSEAEDRGSESLTVLQERMGSVVAFLAALQERADTLERASELKRDEEAAIWPSKRAESAPPAAVPNVDEPPAYPILEVPHLPCACTASSSDDRPHVHSDLPGWCTAIKLRDGWGCRWRRVSGQRFCRIHCVAHGMDVLPHKTKEGALEELRMRVARGEGDKARRIANVKSYVEMLDEMRDIIEEHQRLFLCRSPDSYAAILKDLKKRRTSAGLLLGELSGRMDGKIAENQGQGETWATEFLAEVKYKDAIERRKAVEDLLTGAIVGGALTWLGIPWARSAVAGVITAFVMRKARDATDES